MRDARRHAPDIVEHENPARLRLLRGEAMHAHRELEIVRCEFRLRLHVAEQITEAAATRREYHRITPRHFADDKAFADARRTDEQHVIERFLAGLCGLDEHGKIRACLLLPDEFGKLLRAETGIRRIVFPLCG